MLCVMGSRRISPRVWCKKRSKQWWSEALSGVYGESWWRDNLRITRENLCLFVINLRDKQLEVREPIDVETRVAVTIWWLGTNIEYRSLAALFGLDRSTVGELINDTCSFIACHLMPVYVCIPHGESLRAIIDGFESRWGFPQAVGAIDGSHVPILKPQHSITIEKQSVVGRFSGFIYECQHWLAWQGTRCSCVC